MSATERCSKWIFSGARWDFSGHPCSFKATVQTEDGRWWCKRHHPETVNARDAKRRDEENAAALKEAAVIEHAHAEAVMLSGELGVKLIAVKDRWGSMQLQLDRSEWKWSWGSVGECEGNQPVDTPSET
jgi:hypothetical protein